MSSADIIHYAIQSLTLVLMLSLPPIIMAALVGVLVSLFQALTQIQEQTLSFSIKLVAVSVTIVLTSRWMGIEIYNYALNILHQIPDIG